MRDGERRHMDKDSSRVAIEEGIYSGSSCRSMTTSADVGPSTVTREMRANSTMVEKPVL